MTVPEPTPAPVKKRPGWVIPVSIAGGVLILCCIVSTVAVLADGGKTSAVTSTPTATKSTPKATPNPNAGAAAYAAAIGPEASIMQADFTAIGNDCGAENFSACSSDSQKLHDDAAAWLVILNQHPAPPCLKTADTEIRRALADYETGSSLVVSGINSTDASQITAGSKDLDTGNTAINQATTDIAQAKC